MDLLEFCGEVNRKKPIEKIERFGKELYVMSFDPPLLYDAETKTFYSNIEAIQDKEALLKGLSELVQDARIEELEGKKYVSFHDNQFTVILKSQENSNVAQNPEDSVKPYGRGRKKGGKDLVKRGKEKTINLIIKVSPGIRFLVHEGARKRGLISYSQYIRNLINQDLQSLGLQDEDLIRQDARVYTIQDKMFRQKLSKMPKDQREALLKNEPEVKRIRAEILEKVKQMYVIEKSITG